MAVMQSQWKGRNTKTKTKMEKSKEELIAENKRLRTLIRGLIQYIANSPDYEKMEEVIAENGRIIESMRPFICTENNCKLRHK